RTGRDEKDPDPDRPVREAIADLVPLADVAVRGQLDAPRVPMRLLIRRRKDRPTHEILTVSRVLRDRARLEAAAQEPPLRLAPGVLERRPETVGRILVTTQIPEQLAAHREQPVVVAQMRIALERLDQRQSLGGAAHLPYG